MQPDLLIIGAGVVGLSLADCALRNGLSVCVLDRGEPGREASWAGAGMLTCRPRLRAAHGGVDYHDLTTLSVRLHAEWSARFKADLGIDTGYRVCGAAELIRAEETADHDYAGCTSDTEADPESIADVEALIQGCNGRGVVARRLSAEETRRREPALSAKDLAGSIEFPNEAQIRNPWLLRALVANVQRLGGTIRSGCEIADIALNREGTRAAGVTLRNDEVISGGKVAVCSGAWTAQLPSLVKAAPRCGKIAPVRGQILCFQAEPDFLSRLITDGNHYIVPRGDGVVLVGATHEQAGFEKAVTEDGLAELLNFTRATVAGLAERKLIQHWAGLRPGLKGRHPILGPVPGISGLYVSAGHYRNGLTLAPACAELLVSAILKIKSDIPIGGWSPA